MKPITNLSDAGFKTLVFRMLKEMTEYGHKIKEEVKATQSEIKKNIQRTNSEGEKAGIQISDWEQKEEIDIQSQEEEETRIQNKKTNMRLSLIHI